MNGGGEVMAVDDDQLQQRFESLKAAVAALPDGLGSETALLKRRAEFKSLLDAFMDRPNLLDALLPALTPTLVGYILDPDDGGQLRLEACRYLRMICLLRKAKVVVRHLPHGVELVERVLTMLYDCLQRSADCWEQVYVLLVWMTVLCRAPFQLQYYESGNVVSIERRIFAIMKELRNAMPALRNAAAVVLAEFVTRPDMQQYVDKAFTECIEELRSLTDNEPCKNEECVTSWCVFLVRCFKIGRREVLISKAGWLYKELKSLPNIQWISDGQLRTRMWTKLIQRIAMVFLKPREATWAYKRGVRSLHDALKNLNHSSVGLISSEEPMDVETPMEPLAEEVEEILSTLLLLTQNAETVVRWTAARGIGRISSRLNKARAGEVVDNLLDLFSLLNSVNAWHGGCVALAELGRRGLLMADKIPRLVKVVQMALLYDDAEMGCNRSYEIHDAACYLCWSFGRAFESNDFRPYGLDLAQSLIHAMLFAGDLNSRRAASAAFQENVGRLNVFPSGVEVFTEADYFAVTNRVHCFTVLCPRLARISVYSKGISQHLITNCVAHANQGTRELAADALYTLVPYDRFLLTTKWVPELVQMARGGGVYAKHGALLALGRLTVGICEQFEEEAVYAALPEYQEFRQKMVPEILTLPVVLLEQGDFGKGYGEMLWKAVGEMLHDVCFRARVDVDCERMLTILHILDDHISHPIFEVRLAIGRGFRAVLQCAGMHMEKCREELQKMADIKMDTIYAAGTESERAGAALALGSLPKEVLSPILSTVIDALGKAACQGGDKRLWIEAKRCCLMSLCCIGLSFQPSVLEDASAKLLIPCEDFSQILDFHVACLYDHTRSKNGDVGLLVRQTAVQNLKKLLVHGVQCEYLPIPERITKCFRKLVLEALGKIQAQRQLTCEALSELVTLEPLAFHIPRQEEMVRIFCTNEDDGLPPNWGSDRVAYGRLAKLLSIGCYQRSALLGFCLASGSEYVSTSNVASKILFDHFDSIRTDETMLSEWFKNFIDIFEVHLRTGWITVAIIRVAGKLLLRDYVADEHEESFFEPYFKRLFELVLKCCKNSSNMDRVDAAVVFYCGLFQFTKWRLASDALHAVLKYMNNEYIAVRRKAASRLYEALTLLSVISDAAADAMGILEQTDWSQSTECVAPVCDNLSVLLTPMLST